MKTRTIKSVLNNFLGTYTSRYSNFDGYWLFGFLQEAVKIDLTQTELSEDSCTPLYFVKQLAAAKFREQIVKTNLESLFLKEAHLNITKSVNSINGYVNGHLYCGFTMKFEVTATTDLGKVYQSKVVLFVAPHNSRVESRSARVN